MRHIILFTALFATLSVAAQPYDHPDTVAIGRDTPRGPIEVFASRQEMENALRDGDAAVRRYKRPISDWQRSPAGETVSFSGAFSMPFAWIDRQLFLHVGAVGAPYEVTVNGKPVGYVQDGSSPAEFDITKVAAEGKNRIAINPVTPATADRLLPSSTNLLARDSVAGCHVTAQPRMRVRDIVVDNALTESGDGRLEVGIVMKTHALNPRTTRVYYELTAPDSTKVVEGYQDLTLDMRREDTVRLMAIVPREWLWDADHPDLYTLTVRTRFEGRITEYLPFRIGCRTVSHDDGRLLVNGHPVALRLYEAEGPLQPADAQRIKAEGYNAVRLAPGPFTEGLLEQCDAAGLYVIDQLPIATGEAGISRKIGGNPSNDPAWNTAFLDRTEYHYHQVKRHPSVVAFSLARHSANGINLYESYLRLKELETDRPVIYTESGNEWNNDALAL